MAGKKLVNKWIGGKRTGGTKTSDQNQGEEAHDKKWGGDYYEAAMNDISGIPKCKLILNMIFTCVPNKRSGGNAELQEGPDSPANRKGDPPFP